MTYVDEALVLAMKGLRPHAQVSITHHGWMETRSLEIGGHVLHHVVLWSSTAQVDEQRAHLSLARVTEMGALAHAVQVDSGPVCVWWSTQADGWQQAAQHVLTQMHYAQGASHDHDDHHH